MCLLIRLVIGRLFDKRGAIYSSRPDNYVGGELICPDEVHILLAQYGQGWRALRKSVQGLLNVTAVDALHPVQTAEATQTMCQLLNDPADYYDHIRRYSTAVILASVFGQRGESFQSPKVQALYHAQDRFTAILEPGATPPVDAFPFLKLVPEFVSPWKKEAREIRQEQRSLYYKLLGETRERIREQKSVYCFMERILNDQEKNGFDDEQVAYLGGILVFFLPKVKISYTSLSSNC
jgi:cytochrome P450